MSYSGKHFGSFIIKLNMKMTHLFMVSDLRRFIEKTSERTGQWKNAPKRNYNFLKPQIV